LGPANLKAPPYMGMHIRFVSDSLQGPRDLDNLVVEVIAGAAEPAQTSGVAKVLGFGLTWSEAQGRYRVSPKLVNGIDIVPPAGVLLPRKDLLWLLGFDASPSGAR